MGSRVTQVFSIVVVVMTSLICFTAYQLENPNIAILSVLTPTIVAIIMKANSEGKRGLKELLIGQLINKFQVKWLIISIIGIPVIAIFSILVISGFDVTKIGLRSTQLLPQFVIMTIIGFGEEYGWRGYLLPKLMKRYSLFYASLIVGVIWGIWHFPAYLIGTGFPQGMNFLIFFIWVLMGSLFIGWIYYYTRSVLTSIIIHIVANATFNYLYLLPEFTGSMNNFLSFLIILGGITLSIYWFKRKDLMRAPLMKSE